MATDIGLVTDPALGRRLPKRKPALAPSANDHARSDAQKMTAILAGAKPLLPPGGRAELVAVIARRVAGRGRR